MFDAWESRGDELVLTGRWRIVEMDLGDHEAIDLMGPAFIELQPDRTGSFRFVAVEDTMDCVHGRRDGHPCGSTSSSRGRSTHR